MAARQSRLVRKNADFFTLIGCHGNVPWEIKRRAPDRSSTNKYLSFSAKIAKIGPADPEIIFLRAIIKKWKKLVGKIYSPVGNFDERAKLGTRNRADDMPAAQMAVTRSISTVQPRSEFFWRSAAETASFFAFRPLPVAVYGHARWPQFDSLQFPVSVLYSNYKP